MAEEEAKVNEEAKAKPLEYAAGPVAQLPIKGLSSGYYLWAAEECNCVSREMVAFAMKCLGAFGEGFDCERRTASESFSSEMFVELESCA